MENYGIVWQKVFHLWRIFDRKLWSTRVGRRKCGIYINELSIRNSLDSLKINHFTEKKVSQNINFICAIAFVLVSDCFGWKMDEIKNFLINFFILSPCMLCKKQRWFRVLNFYKIWSPEKNVFSNLRLGQHFFSDKKKFRPKCLVKWSQIGWIKKTHPEHKYSVNVVPNNNWVLYGVIGINWISSFLVRLTNGADCWTKIEYFNHEKIIKKDQS